MRKKCAFLLVLLHFRFGTSRESSECTAREKSMAYLDVASDIIQKVKDNYSSCSEGDTKALDCEDLLKNGFNESKIYTVWPKSRVINGMPVDVYCDMVADGGGWTVIQRRGNYSRPKDNFFRDWASYKQGFGYLDKDFWLGNDQIFSLSNQKLYSIRFDLVDVEGNQRYANYDTFWIDDEDHKYTLHIKGYSGDAGDSMTNHDGQKFTTKDQDNDKEATQNCAQLYKGGWWYSACHTANLNGLDLKGKHESYADGVIWHAWKGHHESMDKTEIKIRPKTFRMDGGINTLTPQ